MVEIPKFGQLEAHLQRIARQAGDLLLKMQPKATSIDQSYKDIVSEADYASEKLIHEELNHEFPDIPVYAEEGSGEAKTSGPLFVVDPIDGTCNFVHQDDHYSASIGFSVDGKSIAGVVHMPLKNISIYADLNMKKGSQVSKVSDFSKAHIWTDWGVGEVTELVLGLLRKMKEKTMYPELRLSCTASMIAVALGKVDGYIHLTPTPFDFAAAALIVEKCGGKATEKDGSPWHTFSKSIVVSNGLIHDQLIELINA